MKPTLRSSGMARRTLLSTLAVLPALSIPMLTVPARAQTATSAAALPSWNDTAPKKAIIAFVERVTKQGSPDFVPVDERIGVPKRHVRVDTRRCVSAWNKDPVFGVIGIQSGPRG